VVKQKLQAKEMEIGRLLTDKNESGELKSTITKLEDQLQRKNKELKERNEKVTMTFLSCY
jgi:hypothetical protein